MLKVVAGYVVACWGIIQLSDMLADEYELPGHPLRWLFGVAILGLPVVLALGWKYDLTPEGMRLTDGPAGRPPDAPRTGPDSPVGEGQIAAVAVLPFDNLTPNTPRAYLANAIPIELQSQLSRIHDLRVVSRQSAVARSEHRADLPTIARNLAVQYVISGSVANCNAMYSSASARTIVAVVSTALPAAIGGSRNRTVTESATSKVSVPDTSIPVSLMFLQRPSTDFPLVSHSTRTRSVLRGARLRSVGWFIVGSGGALPISFRGDPRSDDD